MFHRSLLPALLALALAVPGLAQPKRDQTPRNPPLKSVPQFVALFKPAVETPAKSTVRVLVDGKDAAVGAVVAADGAILTKASEIKAGRVSVKTPDGKERDAKVVATADFFDLALLTVDATGLTPIAWAPSGTAPVGNWVAVVGPGGDPAAVGVVSVAARTLRPPYGPPAVATGQSGFLGVQVSPDGVGGALIDLVSPGEAAEKAGIQPKDLIVQIDKVEIPSQEVLINTLLGYKAGTVVKVTLIRDGKKMELSATLGKRPAEPKGKGPNRGVEQNAMGSVLSGRRTGIPIVLQTDAVVKPTDCGAPLVDLDGKVLGLTIARAGRTESHVIPSEAVQELLPVLLATRDAKTPADRAKALKAAVANAEKAKVALPVLNEAKRALAAAADDEKWWADHPAEKGPAPRAVK